MTFVVAVSVFIRLLATIWCVRLWWRSQDWRLSFLPAMLGLLTLEPLLPALGEAKSHMLQVSIFTVVSVAMFYLLFQNHLRRWGISALRVMLAFVVLYQISYLLTGESLMAPVLLHAELSLSVVLCLNLVLLDRILTERSQVEEQLREEALRDRLTGLPNRAFFMERLRAAHDRTKRQRNYMFAVLFLDLDRFKLLNDSLGHAVGDVFLLQTARRLKSSLRPEDTVARVGGDEFAILLGNLGETAQAERVAERLLRLLAVPHALDKQEIFTTASIGIALSSMGYERPEDLLRDADTAMYRAKAAGQGQYDIFDRPKHENAETQLQLEADLRKTIDRQELLVYYQPIVSLESGEITGCEALLRWNHPDRGLICPAEFIPVAEETGLILPIGEWVLRTACAQNKAWQEAGFADLRVSVNVSVRQLRQQEFTRIVADALHDTGLAPHFLELELTDSAFMENPELTSAKLDELTELGVRIAVDDFGTGYSSISYLRRFAIHTLKIDRSFVSSLSKGESGSAEIITALFTLGRSLDLEVIAEGVESEDQLTFLRSLGCSQAQGFLFGGPIPLDRFTGLLADKRPLVCEPQGVDAKDEPNVPRRVNPLSLPEALPQAE